MAAIATFRQLIAWQKAMELAERVHRTAATFPYEERYGLGRQLQRAGGSVPANIAEGFSRHSRAAYRHHVAIALGSQAEVQTHLELAKRLALIGDELCALLSDLADEVGRLLYGLWRALAPVAVCYSWVLFMLSLGPGPEALGLSNGLPLLP